MNFAFKDKYKDFFGKLFVGNARAGTSGAGNLIGVRTMVNFVTVYGTTFFQARTVFGTMQYSSL